MYVTNEVVSTLVTCWMSHLYLTGVTAVSCGDTCKIWMCKKRYDRYIVTKKLTYWAIVTPTTKRCIRGPLHREIKVITVNDVNILSLNIRPVFHTIHLQRHLVEWKLSYFNLNVTVCLCVSNRQYVITGLGYDDQWLTQYNWTCFWKMINIINQQLPNI